MIPEFNPGNALDIIARLLCHNLLSHGQALFYSLRDYILMQRKCDLIYWKSVVQANGSSKKSNVHRLEYGEIGNSIPNLPVKR